MNRCPGDDLLPVEIAKLDGDDGSFGMFEDLDQMHGNVKYSGDENEDWQANCTMSRPAR